MKAIKTKTKKNIIKISLIALCATPLIALTSLTTSCSHVLNESSTKYETTKINVENTNIMINQSDKIKFTENKETIWQNINLFKSKIASAKILSNINVDSKDICIPYSSIDTLNVSEYKAISFGAFFKRFNYNNEQKIIPNTAFPQSGNYNGDQYKFSISSAKWQELYSKQGDINYVRDFLIRENLLINLPSQTRPADYEIREITTDSARETIIIPFRLKSIYSSTGDSYRDFKLHVSSSSSTYNTNINKEQRLSVKRQNESMTWSYNTKANDDTARHWIRSNECYAVVTFIFSE